MHTFGADLTGYARTLPRTRLLRLLRTYREGTEFRGEQARREHLMTELRKARLTGAEQRLRAVRSAGGGGGEFGMSEALVPAVTRAPVARAGSVGMALPAVIVDAGPVAVERFLEFFAASISNGRTRAAYGRAVGRFLSWCAARGLGLRTIAPLHVGSVHPHAFGVGADGEAAPGRHPSAVRLACRPPGAAGESGRGGAGTEARGDQGCDAGADAGRDAGRCSTGSTRGRWWVFVTGRF